MNILLVYLKRKWSTAEYFEEAFRKFADVDVFNFAETPYWSDFRFKLPFYIPKGIPVSVKSVIEKFDKKFDLIIEIATAGQHHLVGYKKVHKLFPEIKRIFIACDVYRFDQRKFMLWIKNDFDYIFSTQKIL